MGTDRLSGVRPLNGPEELNWYQRILGDVFNLDDGFSDNDIAFCEYVAWRLEDQGLEYQIDTFTRRRLIRLETRVQSILLEDSASE